jgi:hypothetical protein
MKMVTRVGPRCRSFASGGRRVIHSLQPGSSVFLPLFFLAVLPGLVCGPVLTPSRRPSRIALSRLLSRLDARAMASEVPPWTSSVHCAPPSPGAPSCGAVSTGPWNFCFHDALHAFLPILPRPVPTLAQGRVRRAEGTQRRLATSGHLHDVSSGSSPDEKLTSRTPRAGR